MSTFMTNIKHRRPLIRTPQLQRRKIHFRRSALGTRLRDFLSILLQLFFRDGLHVALEFGSELRGERAGSRSFDDGGWPVV